jgi:hypothetical protein
MEPLEPVPGVVRVTFLGQQQGVNVNNTIHVDNGAAGPTSAAQLTILATGMKAAFETHFLPLINANYHELGVHAIDLTSPSGAEAQVASSGTGGKSAFASNAASSVCISWKTSLHYRGGHPRMYLCAGDASTILNGTTIAATELTAYNTAANNFLTAIGTIATTLSVHPVLVRRHALGAKLVPPQVYPITSAVVDSRIDIQRRRLGKDR